MSNSNAGFSCSMESWAAWMPGIETRDAWVEWAQRDEGWSEEEDKVPSSSFLPPRMRRRLSSLNKTSLLSVYQLDADVSGLRSVFASQHGDMQTAVALFKQIAEQGKLSPSLFTRSVFNVNQGLFSIGQNNRQAGTAVSAGASSFFYALLDAVGQLQSKEDPPILVSFYDEPLPEDYQVIVDEPSPRFSMALLLSLRDKGIPLECKLKPARKYTPASTPAPIQFLRWLLRDDMQWEFVGEQLSWNWRKRSL